MLSRRGYVCAWSGLNDKDVGTVETPGVNQITGEVGPRSH